MAPPANAPSSFAWAVDRLLTGHAVPFGPDGQPSAIDKHEVMRPLLVTTTGLAGDEQGDTRHHGGPEKALHHYPADHYATWPAELPDVPTARWRPGGFGENITTHGITEGDVCAGDIYRLGGALLQVSQARQPCWKLNVRFGRPDMARRTQESGRTGWYYRVLEAGSVTAGDSLELIERPEPDWPLSRLLHYLYAEPLNRDALNGIAALKVLSPSWRALARTRLDSGRVEDWSRRLDTPAPHGGTATASRT